jgi:hypothetical protein
MTNTKDEALELTQIDFGGDCDTPPEPWPAIWVAWNSEDGFTFWKHQNQAALWSAADSNEWPVQFSMQKTQPTVPLTDDWIRSKCKQTWVFETAKQWVRMTEEAHGITKGQE